MVETGGRHVVDGVENAVGTGGARPGAGAEQEVETVHVCCNECPLFRGTRVDHGASAEDEGGGHCALLRKRVDVESHELGMRAVGGDEVDERFGVLQVLREVSPTHVRRELAVAGHRTEFTARRVQRWQAGVAAARDVEHRQVERQAH